MIIQQKKDSDEIVQNLFTDEYSQTEVKFGYVSIPPGERLPKEGTTFHEENEYSYITKGVLHGVSGGEPYTIEAGEASLIPAHEEHWCVNNGDEPVELIFALIKGTKN